LDAERLGGMIAVVYGAQTGTKCLLWNQAHEHAPGPLENHEQECGVGEIVRNFVSLAWRLSSF
jgi:hypothetical protein